MAIQDQNTSTSASVAMIGQALTGDPESLRNLVGLVGAFSIRLIVAGLILGVTLWLAGRLARLVERSVARLSKSGSTDPTLTKFVAGFARYMIIAIGLVVVLQQLGVQATSVIAVLGAASLAIGLALQGTLGNVAAGVMILLLRPYRVGDHVELSGRQGTVAAIDLFNTRLAEFEGMTLYVPNGKVFGDMIVNFSKSGRRRFELTFTVDYEDDLDLALEKMLEVARADPRVLGDPEPWAKVTATADSGVNVSMRCWASTSDWFNTKWDLLKAVKEAFDAAGLRFPYPHQVQVDRAPREVTAKVRLQRMTAN
ncbi:mechanosensitive ion channel domain-containing protein [Phenylobacterium sp.]|uniref:mechanosensitive ion channel family protein n=1 Tax=Phenylobacterium sp. TaxID=1871053 RepID=UPI0025DE3105|nr:mechanosensitive ion channel domain-containing protein [Phenylobacterium sp.]